jgi:lysozyme family protein
MKENFEKALAMVLKHEGGFVDHPQDPGGATNKGITLTTYTDFIHEAVGAAEASLVTTDDLRDIHDSEVEEIYKKNYWDKVCADDLPHGLDIALFDFAVNSGPARAVKELQKIFWECKTDGIMGPNTLKCVKTSMDHKQYWSDPNSTLALLTKNRQKFLRTLKHYDHFGRGWEKRCEETKKAANLLCENIPQ